MKKIVIAILVLTAVILTACGSGGSSDSTTLAPVPVDYAGKTNPLGADAAAAGTQVFKTNCESCHGPQGHGDGPVGATLDPQPKNLAELQTRAGDDYLFWRIATGKEGTSMIPWMGILTEEQIWQAVAFINTLK